MTRASHLAWAVLAIGSGRKGSHQVLSSITISKPLAFSDGAPTDVRTLRDTPRADNVTAHVKSADELFIRAGLKKKIHHGPVHRPQRPTTLHLKGGRHCVLLFHGLSSTPAELNYLARGLNRAGYTVRVPVIEGYSHGLNSGRSHGHRDWVAGALAAFDGVRSEYSTVSVGGLCIGSLLALSVSGARPEETSAALGLSTTLHYDGWANPWTRHLLHVLHYVPVARGMRIREREPFGVKDERLRAVIAKQMRVAGSSDAGSAQLRVQDLLEAQRLARLVRRSMRLVKAPTLLIHAKEDESASPRSSFEVAKGVSSQHVRLVLLSNSYHMISIDRERARVLSELKGFLGQHLEHEEGGEPPAQVSRGEAEHRLAEAEEPGCFA